MSALASKPHYAVLDALRGVAALIVVVYHVFECFDWSPLPHGYLAVDFFFVLSGFVIGYAYDDRWGKGLTTREFFARRLIRLHPMVILGAIVGAVCFALQGCVRWDGSHVGLSMVMAALLMNMLMLPMPVGAEADVRGNGEMFPLNGPNWSLMFEYIGNVLYALCLRRLSTRWLAAVAALSGCGLAAIALRDGCLGVGWTLADGGFLSGLLRMTFPYAAGMLLARAGMKQGRRVTFAACGAVIVLIAALPLLFGELAPWASGAYDAVTVVAVFPAVVWLGARSGSGTTTRRISRWLGALSYPLYAVHYPLMYLFYDYIGFSGELVPIGKLQEVWGAAVALPVASVLLAWVAYTCYDRKVRSLLSGQRVQN